jgi:hypothetical protein
MRYATRGGFVLLIGLIAASCGGAESHDASAVPLQADSVASTLPESSGATSSAPGEGASPASTPGESQDAVIYIAEEEPGVTLTLRESAEGGIMGTLTEGGASVPLSARRQGAGFSGTVGPAGGALPVTASERGDRLILEIRAADEVERLTFRRAGTGSGAAAPPTAAAGGQRHVVINDQRLSDEDLAQAEQTYRIRIPDADYWYDRVLGAWGVKNGPTMGFISAGLDLGGALRPDASGGGTNVVVNGRELHPYDLAALQQITGPIAPGRYFITAQGLAGYEGGPPTWDLAALAARSGSSGGGTNSWQSGLTGASGFSDGTTGAVFLPNGGIVSTGN